MEEGLAGSHENVLDKEATTAMAVALVMAMHRGYWHGPPVKLLDCS
jgi:hypothetical protein